ncbi:hypothetical protein Tco_1072413 [Tanacetum coccineum]
MHTQENKIDMGKTLDASLVVIESSGTESGKHDTSSKSINDTNTDNADIKPIYDEEPMAENQAFKSGQHGQILNEASNKAKMKKDIDAYETINIELEHSVAKLLTKNEHLNKENETLKKHYKDLKLKGNSVDTKFAKPSVLGKPVLQPLRNQSVVRQPNAFKSEGPKISKPLFAPQVDVKKDLSKPITQYYLPKGREFAFAKPDYVIASSESRNISKNMPRFSSNDMVHNHYIEEARKKTQERNRNSKSSVMHNVSPQNTTNGSKPKPKSNNQTSACI